MGIRIGMNYWFGLPSLPEVRIPLLKNAGFNEVSLQWTNEYEEANGEKHRIAELLQLNGFQISSFHLTFERSHFIWQAGDVGDRLISEYMKSIEEAREYEVENIVLHIDNRSLHRDYKVCRDRLNSLVAYSMKHGIHLCFENLHKEDNLDFLSQEGIDAEYCYDVGHENIKRIELSAFWENIRYVHLHDNDGYIDQHALPFSGMINWIGLMKKLSKVKYNCEFLLEVHNDSLTLETAPSYLEQAQKICTRLLGNLQER